MTNLDRIYLINLERSKDRLDHFMEEVERIGLPKEKLESILKNMEFPAIIVDQCIALYESLNLDFCDLLHVFLVSLKIVGFPLGSLAVSKYVAFDLHVFLDIYDLLDSRLKLNIFYLEVIFCLLVDY